MLKFNAKDYNELEEELKIRHVEFSITILKSIINALEADMDTVVIGLMPSTGIEIRGSRENYIDALTLNLYAAKEEEEYELCAKVEKWIKILESEDRLGDTSLAFQHCK